MSGNYPAGVDSTDIDRHFGNSDTRIEDGICLNPCLLCGALAVPHELPERGEPGGGCEGFEQGRQQLARDIGQIHRSDWVNKIVIADLLCADCSEFLDGLGYTLGGFEA